jgi:hypothetical protein
MEELKVPGVKPVPVPYGLPQASDWKLMTNTVSYGTSEVVPVHTMESNGGSTGTSSPLILNADSRLGGDQLHAPATLPLRKEPLVPTE